MQTYILVVITESYRSEHEYWAFEVKFANGIELQL